MAKKGGSSPPPAPDPIATAKAQAQVNRINRLSPDGSGTIYGRYIDGKFHANKNRAAVSYVESPTEKKTREMLEPASIQLTERIIEDNIENIPEAARVRNFDDMAQTIFDAGYNRMKPSFDQQNDKLMANLQARGIPVGSEAFNEAYESQQRAVNDAMIDLTSRSTQAAGAEQSRQYGVDSAARANSVSELIAAMGGNYNPQTQIPSGNVPQVDVAGLIGNNYNQQMAAHNASQANKTATLGTLGSLGGAALLKSDRRLKTDIVKVGTRRFADDMELNVYGYRYFWEKPGTMRIGYMAQEVLALVPKAVGRIGAFLALDYDQLPEVENA